MTSCLDCENGAGSHLPGCPKSTPRLTVLAEVHQVILDMDAAYDGAGRKVSRGEIIKWLEHELGRSKK